MNRQEIYNTVAKHLLTQGVASRIERGPGTIPACMYRGPNGTKCAVGCLISDDEYKPELEYHTLEMLWRDFPQLSAFQNVDENDITFLANLQTIHDVYTPDTWKMLLEKFAMDHGLVPYVHSI